MLNIVVKIEEPNKVYFIKYLINLKGRIKIKKYKRIF